MTSPFTDEEITIIAEIALDEIKHRSPDLCDNYGLCDEFLGALFKKLNAYLNP